jgi:hypothetical protein
MQPCFPLQEITVLALGWHSFLQLSMWVSSILNCIMQRKYSLSLWTVYASTVCGIPGHGFPTRRIS